MAEPSFESESNLKLASSPENLWNTVVLNDAVNLQSYVVFVFREHFGYSKRRADYLMMQVHVEGRAIVSTDERETAESHVLALHSYGLNAILEPAGEE